MKSTLSIVINTKNSAPFLEKCLRSVRDIADQIVIMDMQSSDQTVEIAKRFKAEIYLHEDVGFVEPARNAALSHATSDWIFVIDSDEELSPSLRKEIPTLLQGEVDAYFVPRSNIIFDKAMKTGWWPDYQLRLFRNGSVKWPETIHAVPQVTGEVKWLEPKRDTALIHHNYQSIDQFVDRAQRYSSIAAAEQSRNSEGKETLRHPVDAFFAEFFSRWYANNGFDDELHGQYLSLFQGWTRVLELARAWERDGFPQKSRPLSLSALLWQRAREAKWWENREQWEKSRGLARWYWRVRMKLRV